MYKIPHIPICIFKALLKLLCEALALEQDVLKPDHVNNCRQVSASLNHITASAVVTLKINVHVHTRSRRGSKQITGFLN